MKGIDLKLERVKAGVTQARVAALLGVSQTVLHSIEAGKRPVNHEEAAAVLKAIRIAASGTTATLVPLNRGRIGNFNYK